MSEENQVDVGKSALSPPPHYASWIAYAVENMPTRDLFNQQFFAGPEEMGWDHFVQRHEMIAAARAEWKKVQMVLTEHALRHLPKAEGGRE